jgi:hypothetical protein
MSADHQDHQEGWRELARQIQEEKDPQKMIALVQQLIATFERQNARKAPTVKPEAQNRPNSPQT